MCVSDCTDGIEFFWSENHVLLTAGDAEGKLLPKYFSRALRLRPTSKEKRSHGFLTFRFFSFKTWIEGQHLRVHWSHCCPVFQGASCRCSSSRGCCSVIGHSKAHLTVLAPRGWLMLIPVPLVTLVVWQKHPSEVILVSNKRIHSEIILNETKWLNF